MGSSYCTQFSIELADLWVARHSLTEVIKSVTDSFIVCFRVHAIIQDPPIHPSTKLNGIDKLQVWVDA